MLSVLMLLVAVLCISSEVLGIIIVVLGINILVLGVIIIVLGIITSNPVEYIYVDVCTSDRGECLYLCYNIHSSISLS